DGGDRRRRIAVGYACRRHRAGAGADDRRAAPSARLSDRRPCGIRRRTVRTPLFRRPRRAAQLTAREVGMSAAAGMTVERWTPASRLAVGAVAAAIVGLALAPFLLGAGLVDRLTALFIYVMLAAMWNALAGFGGLVSVGQQLFFGVGAYFTVRLADAGIDPFVSIFIA